MIETATTTIRPTLPVEKPTTENTVPRITNTVVEAWRLRRRNGTCPRLNNGDTVRQRDERIAAVQVEVEVEVTRVDTAEAADRTRPEVVPWPHHAGQSGETWRVKWTFL